MVYFRKGDDAMRTTMSYDRYDGSVELDEEHGLLAGRVLGIQEKITYEARDAEGLVRAFHEAVDEYLSFCKKDKIQPEVPFRGTFNVRLPRELHRRLVLQAMEEHTNLNRLVTKILASYEPIQEGSDKNIR